MAKHSRSPKLSAFLRERRGKRTTTDMDALIGSSSYWRYETLGYLPTKDTRLKKLAEALETTPEMLKTLLPPKGDILPLLKVVVEGSCTSISIEELMFLYKMQKNFRGPVSARLAVELLTHYREEK